MPKARVEVEVIKRYTVEVEGNGYAEVSQKAAKLYPNEVMFAGKLEGEGVIVRKIRWEL